MTNLDETRTDWQKAPGEKDSSWGCFRLPKLLLFPFALGFALVPLVIILHECGHFGVMSLLGLQPHLTAIGVYTTSAPGQGMETSRRVFLEAAGPLVEVVCCVSGFMWLKARRKNCRDADPDAVDWVATALASMSARWISAGAMALWGIVRSGRLYNGDDEGKISVQLGLPSWAVPMAFWVAALYVSFSTVFQHPKGKRLVPFAVLGIGETTGACVWAFILGPLLLGSPPFSG